VTGALERLRSEFDVVVIEGAGSPAEINLRQGDIVNMEVALHAKAPVLLVGDIDKGEVFASLYGTMMQLADDERKLVAGTVVNKFRGDVSILLPGLRTLEELTGVPVLGDVPYIRDIQVAEEDSPAGQNMARSQDAIVDVAVIALPHISNFDDFDPLAREQDVGLRYVRSSEELGEPDLVVLPGTKTTIADLAYLRATGLANGVVELAAKGAAVVGICGGYQMLGRLILDPDLVESREGSAQGLGLLAAVMRFSASKATHQVCGEVDADRGLLESCRGLSFDGYEIHMGTIVADTTAPAPFRLSRPGGWTHTSEDGLLSAEGWTLGTYVHGLFHNNELRRNILGSVEAKRGRRLRPGQDEFSQSREYDRLADLFRASLDMKAIYGASGLSVTEPPGLKSSTRPLEAV